MVQEIFTPHQVRIIIWLLKSDGIEQLYIKLKEGDPIDSLISSLHTIEVEMLLSDESPYVSHNITVKF